MLVLIFKNSIRCWRPMALRVTGVMVIDTFNAGLVAGKQWRMGAMAGGRPVRRHGNKRSVFWPRPTS